MRTQELKGNQQNCFRMKKLVRMCNTANATCSCKKMCNTANATCSCKRLCTAVFCRCGCFLAKSVKRVPRVIIRCNFKMVKFLVTTEDLLQAKIWIELVRCKSLAAR